jgi:hypothetical protein
MITITRKETLLTIVIVFLFQFSSCSNDNRTGNRIEQEFLHSFGQDSLSVKLVSWGLAGNHERVIIKNTGFPQDSLTILSNTIFFKQISTDSLLIVGGNVESGQVTSKNLKLEVRTDYNFRRYDYDKDSSFLKVSLY